MSLEINISEQRDFRRQLRSNGTPAEGRLWKLLRARQVEGLQFRRQYGMGKYILDFYCPELKLAIELDGNVHDNSVSGAHDAIRDKVLREYFGREIFRYKNIEVLRQPDVIIDAIISYKNSLLSNLPIIPPPNPLPEGGGEPADSMQSGLRSLTE